MAARVEKEERCTRGAQQLARPGSKMAAAAEGSPVAPAMPPALPEGDEDDADAEAEEDEATAGPSRSSSSAGFRLTAVRRDPAVRLQHPVSGLAPLAWSEDHRIAVSTSRSVAVLEQLSDAQGSSSSSSCPSADLVLHRTAVPGPADACHLKVRAHPRPSDSQGLCPRERDRCCSCFKKSDHAWVCLCVFSIMVRKWLVELSATRIR